MAQRRRDGADQAVRCRLAEALDEPVEAVELGEHDSRGSAVAGGSCFLVMDRARPEQWRVEACLRVDQRGRLGLDHVVEAIEIGEAGRLLGPFRRSFR